VKSGVRRTHILPGMRPHALLTEVFTNEGVGTMILGPDESKVYEHEELAADESTDGAATPPS
jgi:hypothetical protein